MISRYLQNLDSSRCHLAAARNATRISSHTPPESGEEIHYRAIMSAAYPRYSYIISKYVWPILFFYPRAREGESLFHASPNSPTSSSSLQLILLYRAGARGTEITQLNNKRTLDPLFALTIGLSAATVRIQREERAAGRNGDLIAVGKKGWDLVANSTEGVLGFWMRDGRGRVWYFSVLRDTAFVDCSCVDRGD